MSFVSYLSLVKLCQKTLVVNHNFLELVLGIRDALIFTYPFWVTTDI